MKSLKRRLHINDSGYAHHYIVAFLVIVIIALVGVRVIYESRAASNACTIDPSQQIESLPSGAVWDGGYKCYSVPYGIRITKPITIEHATFINPQTSPHPGNKSLLPIIFCTDTSNVTLTGLVLRGEHTTSGYTHLKGVGEEGMKIYSCNNVTINGVITVNTGGDGLMIADDNPKNRTPSTNLNIRSLLIVNTGRQGITVADAKDATFTNVDIASSADTGWDFESDLDGVGSSNVTINDAKGVHGIDMLEALQGPVTFNNIDIQGHVDIHGQATNGQPITFNGGTIELPRNDNGTPPAGIDVDGPGNLTFNNVKISNVPPAGSGGYAATGRSWIALNGGSITFNNSPVSGPVGARDATSKVLITKS